MNIKHSTFTLKTLSVCVPESLDFESLERELNLLTDGATMMRLKDGITVDGEALYDRQAELEDDSPDNVFLPFIKEVNQLVCREQADSILFHF